jgi:hypothetical protein
MKGNPFSILYSFNVNKIKPFNLSQKRNKLILDNKNNIIKLNL